ncbi:rpa-associated protein [Natronomonas moolapensis 8.8.11]|uniref:Rpa-associated protein n=1 Tax=Natronomonas moolapensis (strain DSM 18674 / CECT 7526 / JCM 14361 / 8.8.11) TaxID=268739 RepID=M1XSH9_NATM8|nr:rpa-associated protein [Natronomonas moolapensis]CCQ37329.1 rpa-associated protein [Natronomonas moolapensis 8.8.11]
MSDSESGSGSAPGRREVAYRLFAVEFDDSERSYSESNEERAPNYVVTPTGARVNRLFAIGVLTEVDDVNPEMVRGRLVDPTGAFVTYAGQYQPDALAVLERADPPAFFSLSGKARTYEPDDGDRIYSSVRPETVSEVDAETRDRWVVTAAERTLERIGVMAAAIESGLVGDQLRAALAEAGVDDRLADGVALAVDYYGTTPAYLADLRRVALEAVAVVAGEREAVSELELAPGEGTGDAGELATVDLAGAPTPESAAAAAGVGDDGSDAADAGAEPDAGVEPEPEPDPDPTSETEPGPETGVGTDAEPEATAETAADPGPPADADTTAEPASMSDAAADSEPTTPSEPGSEPTPETGSDPGAESSLGAGTDAADPLDGPTPDPEPVGDDALSDPEDVDPGEFELDESERQAVEEEYGTEFSTADEVEPADIEPEGAGTAPDAEPDTGTDATGTDATGVDGEPGEPHTAETPASESAGGDTPEAEAAGDAEPDTPADAEPVDLDEAVVATMGDLDDGEGVDRDELVSAVADARGVAPADVEDAIQDALMSGRCYEPSDDTLKRI